MVAFFTKSDLAAGIADFLAEDSMSPLVVDRLIAFADTDIKLELDIQPMERRADLVITADEDVVAPSRMISVVSLYIPLTAGRRAPVEYVTPSGLQKELARWPDGGGVPRFYTTEGREDADPVFVFAPGPNQTYIGNLLYRADPELVADDDTNEILLKYPSIYLYGALKHAENYLRNPAQAAEARGEFDALIAKLQQADRKRRLGGTTLHVRSRYRIG